MRFDSIPLLPEDLFEALQDEPAEQDISSPARGAV
jgi:hypothetical protein